VSYTCQVSTSRERGDGAAQGCTIPSIQKELGTQFYDRGYNVLVASLPYNGLADRLTTEQAKVRADDLNPNRVAGPDLFFIQLPFLAL
jgi:hypothetical protein